MLRHEKRPVLLLALLLACGTPSEPSEPSDQLIRTDHAVYELRSTEYGLEVEIPFTFENRTGRTVYVVNCHEHTTRLLEKRVDGEWVHAWAGAVPLCLSSPIVIAPEATYRDTLQVFAGNPSNNMFPKFEVQEASGTYRLVWYGVLRNYDHDRQGFGDPVPLAQRISNTFQLERE